MKNALLSKSNPCDVHWRKCRHFLSQGHFLNWDIYFKKLFHNRFQNGSMFYNLSVHKKKQLTNGNPLFLWADGL